MGFFNRDNSDLISANPAKDQPAGDSEEPDEQFRCKVVMRDGTAQEFTLIERYIDEDDLTLVLKRPNGNEVWINSDAWNICEAL